MTIIYLHGFASTGVSPKVDQLIAKFGSDKVISPDLPMDPVAVHKLIDSIILKFIDTRKDNEKLIFVGTSLGAFYANYFGHLYDCPVVLVNPSTNPSETLKAKLGLNTNYMSGEEFVVTMAYLDEFLKMRKYVESNYSGSLVNIFVAKDDDVIPYESVLEYFPYTTSFTVTEDGGHRFTKHWSKVVERIAEIAEVHVAA